MASSPTTMATLGSVTATEDAIRDGPTSTIAQKTSQPNQIKIRPKTAKATAIREADRQLALAPRTQAQHTRHELDTTTPYATDVGMMVSLTSSSSSNIYASGAKAIEQEVSLRSYHAGTERDRLRPDQERKSVSLDSPEGYGAGIARGYHAPPFSATPALNPCPYPDPTTSMPLWDDARTALGRPNYFQEMMRKHYPWDEQLLSFVAGESTRNSDVEHEEGDEARDAHQDGEAEDEENAEPFFLRNHDQVLQVEQLLSDFRVQLTACKYWEDEDALQELGVLLKIARDQVWMLPQPQPGDEGMHTPR